MQDIAAVVLWVLLLFTLLFSVQIACGFGELCGIRPGRDKSGLGGFAMLLIFFPIRWLGLAALLAFVARPGESWWLLAGHAVLGLASVQLFQRGVDRVHRDLVVPWLAGLAGSTLIPAPAWLLIVYRALAGRLGDTAAVLGCIAVLLLHAACYRQRRTGMLTVA